MGPIFSSKDYYCFEQNQLTIKKLNIFQRFFRFLGFYANTREQVVASLAAAAFFEQNQQFAVKEDSLDYIERRDLYLRMATRAKPIKLNEVTRNGNQVSFFAKIRETADQHLIYEFAIKVLDQDRTEQEMKIAMTRSLCCEKNLRVALLTKSILPKDLYHQTFIFLNKLFMNAQSFEILEPNLDNTKTWEKCGFKIGIPIPVNKDMPAIVQLDKTEAKKASEGYPLLTPISVDALF